MNTQRTGCSSDPNLALLLNPEDEAHFVSVCEAVPGRQGGMGLRVKQSSLLYVVVHRRYGAWTHLYRVAADGRPGRLLVYLEMIFRGDCLAEATDWARRKLCYRQLTTGRVEELTSIVSESLTFMCPREITISENDDATNTRQII